MRASLLVWSLLLAACAASSEQPSTQGRHAARLAAARPAGAPVSCVNIQQIRTTHVLDDRTIDFELVNGSTLRNTLPNSCPSLGFEEAFSYSTSLTRLCSVDIITVLHQGGGPLHGASCGLGQFQPVTFLRQ